MRKLVATKACSSIAALVILLLFALASSSCVTSTAYKPDPSHPVGTVSISKEVAMPPHMIFYGLSQSMAGLFAGPFGALTTMFRQGEDFNLPAVLRSDLAAELGSTKFKVMSSGPADAEVRIRVREYGFVQAPGIMRRQVKPILTIDTEMVRPDGTVTWKSGVVVNQTTKGTPATLPEQLKADPKLAAEAIQAAARIWATKTAASLR